MTRKIVVIIVKHPCARSVPDKSSRKLEIPPATLSDDMMIDDARKELYEDEVSVMEMICASACNTSMTQFTPEKKGRGNRALDNQLNEINI